MRFHPPAVWRPALFAIALGVFASGCASMQSRMAPSRLQNGYTIVLPGIDSAGPETQNIVWGLSDSGLNTAVEVDDWTTGTVALALIHLRNEPRNRQEAQRIAGKIVGYRNQFPGRPVNLVGFSGGGALICYILEALPAEHQVDSVVLLAPAISPFYPIDKLLPKTRRGIWNFYSPLDISLSTVGTTVAGTMDGYHGASAGAAGFVTFDGGGSKSGGPRLHQIRYQPAMLREGNYGGHFGPTCFQFVHSHVAPLLN